MIKQETQPKEKPYTVEIPNMTAPDHYVLRKYAPGQVCIWCFESDEWKGYECYQLTEAEIKKDFEQFWKYAEEVK